MRNHTAAVLFLVMIAGLVPTLGYADWRQFRGTDITGLSVDDNVPTKWSTSENIGWKADLPGRGLSSPIVVGDQVFVTAATGPKQDRLHVMCFNVSTGNLEWDRQFWATGRTVCHPKTCNAAPTPTSDGKHVYALFSSGDLACVNNNGRLEWFRGMMVDYPNASNSLGMASSPVIAGNTLVVPLENDSQSITTGIDLATGETKWKSDRPKRANWTSPTILRGDIPAADVVLLQSSAGIDAIQPDTGNVVWKFDAGASTIPSAAVGDGLVYVPSKGMTALRPTGTSTPEVLWQVERLSPGTASPIVLGDRLYALNRAGVLLSVDPKNGETKWQLRLAGPFSGSPIASRSHLYLANEKGTVFVVQPGDTEGTIVAENELEDEIQCTPAISGSAFFVRSDKHLWKVGR